MFVVAFEGARLARKRMILRVLALVFVFDPYLAEGPIDSVETGVLLVGEGSGCFGSIFLSLDTVRSWGGCISSRRALLQEDSCGRFFLIPWGRFPRSFGTEG